ncbi:MAG: hydantoinase/oxoprolinase family protein, partial [Hyphomicrobiaceae bacterium]
LDVRDIGIAGGSLIRAERGRLVDVGPRSAHIAGLAYAAFAEPAVFEGATLELFEPKPGDGANHVAIRTTDGHRFALTNTCAANVLGYAKPGHHAYGNPDAARRAFEPLADFLGCTVDEAARRVLDCSVAKVLPVVADLINEYQLDIDQQLLIGEGGGAAALVPYAAEQAGLRHEISRDAEVISSIGVALALVRDVVERIVPHPQPEDLIAIRKEALDAVIRLGADPTQVDVTVEVDTLTHRVRATAMGAAEMHVKDESGGIAEREARARAARSLDMPLESVTLAAATSGFRVYQSVGEGPRPLRTIDWQGAIRVQRSRALASATAASDIGAALSELWYAAGGGNAAAHSHPGVVMLYERHLVDLTGIEDLDQALALAKSELEGHPGGTAVALIAMPSGVAA